MTAPISKDAIARGSRPLSLSYFAKVDAGEVSANQNVGLAHGLSRASVPSHRFIPHYELVCDGERICAA